MEGWKKILLYAGGAAGAAAVLYYLLREEEGNGVLPEIVESSDSKKKLRVEDVTKEQVQKILNDIIESQDRMKARMKGITQEMMTKSVPVLEAYERIKAVQPEDPLTTLGLTPMDFDALISKFQNDPEIRLGIAKLMGMPDPMAPGPTKSASVSAEKVVEAHTYMLEQLETVLADFNKLPNRPSLDPKFIVQAAQAIVAARLEQKLGLSSDDMEAAMMKHQQTLAMDQKFAAVSMKLQKLMEGLMGQEG